MPLGMRNPVILIVRALPYRPQQLILLLTALEEVGGEGAKTYRSNRYYGLIKPSRLAHTPFGIFWLNIRTVFLVFRR